jgi:SnoaL-like domain
VHPNEEVVREAYEAFARRDMPALFELLSDEITFVIPGKSIQSGVFSGKEEVHRYFSIAGTHTGGPTASRWSTYSPTTLARLRSCEHAANGVTSHST